MKKGAELENIDCDPKFRLTKLLVLSSQNYIRCGDLKGLQY